MTILKEVHKRPGSSIADIQRRVGSSHHNVSRHLRVLAKTGRTECEKDTRTSHHFLVQHRALHIRMLPFFRDSEHHRAIQILASHPNLEWNFNELAQTVIARHSRISKLVNDLEKRGLVHVRKWNTRYYVRGTPRLKKVLHQHEQSEYAEEARETRKRAIHQSPTDKSSLRPVDPTKTNGHPARGNGHTPPSIRNGNKNGSSNGTFADPGDPDGPETP